MPFVLICTDKPDSLDLRRATRPQHLDYMNGSGRVLEGGPILDEEGQPKGSLIVIDVATRADAEAFSASDPYALAGLFADVRIEAWHPLQGKL